MKLPSDIKPRRLVKGLTKAGFLETHKVGSHIHLHHPDCRRTQVAVHPKLIARGTRKTLINLLFLGLLVLGLPVGIQLVQSQKLLKSFAATESIRFITDGVNVAISSTVT